MEQTSTALSMEGILMLVQTVSIILAIIVAVVTLKGKGETKSSALTEMMVDIKYIKQSVACIDPLKDKINEVDTKAESALTLINAHVARHDSNGK